MKSYTWTAIFAIIIAGGLATGYAVADHKPDFLRTFGCSLPK